MKIFLDTNVILDFLAAREPWSIDAARIFVAAEENRVSLHTTLVSMVNCLFILRSRYGRANNAANMLESLDFIKIIATSEDTFKKSLASDFKDRQDAIQYFTAIGIWRLRPYHNPGCQRLC